ncbi:MAG: EscS/YscS/HrcS family type III secretion system export apparatus protein [SAR324 cluster bacterium]|uniref:EscS/YscS/HrcS family type III secretion system export apparatus protein n=1 Tax=SAR324 cluster bacterium TaxID=2024889 RepID=A0A2A4STK6_9DELT|nr:MAG: EscS/YscS/HrcS family type III secretion system export apparatus protein [SAR324 cluster bacterium]
MTPEFVTSFAADAILVTVKLSAPPLLVALILGLAVSIFQAVTQIQEMTLAIIPKMMGVMGVLIIFLPWFITVAADYMEKVLTNIPFYVGLG